MVQTRQSDFIRPSTRAAATLLSVLLFVINAEAQKVERINFAGGPPSGVFGIFATGIGTYLSQNIKSRRLRGRNRRFGGKPAPVTRQRSGNGIVVFVRPARSLFWPGAI